MNAVVLASKDGKSAVLLKDGSIRNIPKEYRVGETVHVATRQATVVSYVSAAAAAVCLFVVGLFGYNYQTCKPCSYVTLDVNPSIEFEVDSHENIVSIEALNSDAEPIVASVIEQMDKKKTSFNEAVYSTLDVLTTNNYLNADENNVLLFDVVSKNDKKSDKLIDTINEIANNNSGDEYHIISSSMEDHQEAVNNNMSTGRYAMMLDDARSKGTEVNDDAVITFKSKSVRSMVTGEEDVTADVEEESTEQAQTSVSTDSGSDKTKEDAAKQKAASTVQTVTSQSQTTTVPAQTAETQVNNTGNDSSVSNTSDTTSVSATPQPKKVTTEAGRTETVNDSVDTGSTTADTGAGQTTDTQSGDNQETGGSGSGGSGKSGSTAVADQPGNTDTTTEPAAPEQPAASDDIGGGDLPAEPAPQEPASGSETGGSGGSDAGTTAPEQPSSDGSGTSTDSGAGETVDDNGAATNEAPVQETVEPQNSGRSEED